MTVQSVLFLIFFVINIASKTSFAQEIDIGTANIILNWTTFPVLMTCGNRAVIEITCSLKASMYECKNKSVIGPDCSTPFNPCVITPSPCENGGTCHPNNTFPLKYYCECPYGFSGYDCDKDDQTCKTKLCLHDGTCLEMHEIVSLVNETTFDCDCKDGYDGIHCELLENLCWNITCENNALCVPSFLSWSCVCLSSMYSGIYCQDKSAALVVREVLSKSFAFIAITAITAVFVFVIIMDVLKYGFKIDPVDRERRLMILEQRKIQLQKRRKKARKNVVEIFYVT